MGVELRMLETAQVSCLLFVAATAQGQVALEQGAEAPEFRCPETNGKFRDSEQCDLFYICRKGSASIEFCPEGLLFDDKIPNHEKCVLPHNVDCGDRIYVQEPSPDRDPKCERANGIFNVKVGSCVRKEQASEEAKRCDGEKVFEIDGFTCPGGETFGPQNLLQAHPIYPHPTDCRSYFSCYHNKEPNKFGCSEGNVFAADSQTCKPAEEVPECSCWYSCPEDSNCPDDCNADCTCPVL